jgi:hypothetical protein
LIVSTAKFKGLLLLCCALIPNARVGVAIKEARKEWHPPKQVVHSANMESKDKLGFIQLPDSF